MLYFFTVLATQIPMELNNIVITVAIASASITIILTTVLVLTMVALVNARRKLGVQICSSVNLYISMLLNIWHIKTF